MNMNIWVWVVVVVVVVVVIVVVVSSSISGNELLDFSGIELCLWPAVVIEHLMLCLFLRVLRPYSFIVSSSTKDGLKPICVWVKTEGTFLGLVTLPR